MPTSTMLPVNSTLVGAPSYSFDTDLDTGFYRIGADNIGVSTAGTKRIDINTTRTQVSQILQILGSYLEEDMGADIAAGAAIDFATATGNYFRITNAAGATNVANLGGANIPAGTEFEAKIVITGGSVTLVYDANLIDIPGGANLPCQNGDYIRFRKTNDANAYWAIVGLTRGLSSGTLTTKGDLLAGLGAGATTRLGVGSDGKGVLADSSATEGLAYFAKKMYECGRLTIVSGNPVPSVDVTGAATIYFTPYKGNVVELYNGSGWYPYVFAELSQTLADATKSPAAAVADRNYDLFVWLDGVTLRCTRGPVWRNGGQVITGATNAGPIVITANAHGLSNGDIATVSNVKGNTAANGVWTVANVTANTFELQGSVGNGAYTAGTGSFAARGVGANTTELELFEGRYVNKVAITNGAAARRGLYVGTIRTAAGGATVSDSLTTRHVWNMFNRVLRQLRVVDTTDSWTYALSTFRQANNSTANQFDLVRGLDEDSVSAHVTCSALNSTATARNCEVGIGINTVTISSAINHIGYCSNGQQGPLFAHWTGNPGLGRNYVAWLEVTDALDTKTFYGDGGGTAIQSGMVGATLA
jgi:hypothetical protein